MHRREKRRTGKSGQTANAEVRDRRDADILRPRTAGLSARACNGTLCTSTGARSSASLCAWSWASCQCSKPVFFRFFLGTPIVCPTCFVAWSSSRPGQGATRTARDAHRARRSGQRAAHRLTAVGLAARFFPAVVPAAVVLVALPIVLGVARLMAPLLDVCHQAGGLPALRHGRTL